jgi:hypothetical protein
MANEDTAAPEICGAESGHEEFKPSICQLTPGHDGLHANGGGLSWRSPDTRTRAGAGMSRGIEPTFAIGGNGGAGHDPRGFASTISVVGAGGGIAGGSLSGGGPSPGYASTHGVGGSGFRYNVVPGTEGLPGAGYFSQRRDVKPAAEPAKPGVPEVLLAGLVACGRELGRIERELEQRQHWKRVLEATLRTHFAGGPDAVPTEQEWAKAGQYLHAHAQLIADAPQSEPEKPIQERAEALAILLLRGQVGKTPPNALIRAGVAFEVLRSAARSAWRKSKRGGT